MLQGGETGRWMLYNKQQSKYNQHAHIYTSLQEALLEQALKLSTTRVHLRGDALKS